MPTLIVDKVAIHDDLFFAELGINELVRHLQGLNP